MMSVYEQRRARTVAAEDFEQPAVLRLRQPTAAVFFRNARAEHSELAETVDDALGDYRFAVDRNWIDFRLAVGLQFVGERSRVAVGGEIGIGEQLAIGERAEEQAFGEADVLQTIAEELFGF